GEIAPRRDARLRGEVLDQHRHEVRGKHNPQQEIAELRSAGDVRREVAGVDVGHARDEGRAHDCQGGPHTPARADPLERARRRERERAVDSRRRWVHAVTSTRMARASAPPITWTSSWKRTKSGPSNGCLSTTSRVAPGAIPRSPRYLSISGSESEMRTKR